MSALVAIWTRQYVRPKDIGERICMTDERMTKLVNDAYDAGFTDGERQGRSNLRRAIEAGEVDEIKRAVA